MPNTNTPSTTSELEADFRAITARPDTPIYRNTLSPHRSLSNQGFFVTIMFTALWYFIRRNDKDGTLYEELTLWPDLIAVHRHNPRKPDQFWHANPYWVTVQMRDTKDCKNYLTLKGGAREIELGAFLSSDGRKALHQELREKLTQATNTTPN